MTETLSQPIAAGRSECRTVADRAAARRRTIPDRRTPERRVDAEHRRGRRQATTALDRRLAESMPDSWPAAGFGAYAPIRAARYLERVETEQRFTDTAAAYLADALRAVDWADATEVLRRVEVTAEVLRTLIDTKEVA
ncbi:hypothetical protein [Nocardia cyriacigeorgica]|uniref:hypothetical protein n=1 Tax=Nocardia cyriacigeorgica TaxID=135487 RepID=UPI00189540B0|nr:hypothetical protein [Nocardia cyriacigeorgica]MBF6286916.1 hypothetical protein [Nocardia cyriacigeorgica]